MHNYLRIYILYILSLNKYDKYEELYRTLLSVVIEPSNLLEACASAELCAEQCSLVETESSENVILEPLFSTTLWINLANDFSYSILMAHGFSKYCTVHSWAASSPLKCSPIASGNIPSNFDIYFFDIQFYNILYIALFQYSVL